MRYEGVVSFVKNFHPSSLATRTSPLAQNPLHAPNAPSPRPTSNTKSDGRSRKVAVWGSESNEFPPSHHPLRARYLPGGAALHSRAFANIQRTCRYPGDLPLEKTMDMPFVAIIGGFWKLKQDDIARAKEAGKSIGEELARAGFGLVVYFSNDEALEPHVVSGYVAALANRMGSIHVRYAESQRGQVRFPEEVLKPELFEHRVFPSPDWEVPFYRSLAEEGVDAVLLLAGETSTYIAGQIAVARRLPMLAVDQFGGSAAKIWNQLAQASPEKGLASWGKRPTDALVVQLKNECATVAARRQEGRRRDQILGNLELQSAKTAHAAGAFFLLILTLFFGMVYTPFLSAYPIIMLVGLIASGATGALVRSLLRTSTEAGPWTSSLLGGIAGFVVGLAYLIPQWVGAPGVLEPKVGAVTSTDKIQFASAVLVALSAGVGFDTVFSRLQKQAQDAAVGPPR